MPPKQLESLGRSPLLDLPKPWETGAPISKSNFVFPHTDPAPWIGKYEAPGSSRVLSTAEIKANRQKRLKQLAEIHRENTQGSLDADYSGEEDHGVVSQQSCPISTPQQASNVNDAGLLGGRAVSERNSPTTPTYSPITQSASSESPQPESTSIWPATHQQESPILGSMTTPPPRQAFQPMPAPQRQLPSMRGLTTSLQRGLGLQSRQRTSTSIRPRGSANIFDLPDYDAGPPALRPLTAAERQSAAEFRAANMISGDVALTAGLTTALARPTMTTPLASSQQSDTIVVAPSVVPQKRKAQDSGISVMTSSGNKVVLIEVPEGETVAKLLQKGRYRGKQIWFLCQFEKGSKAAAEPISRVALMKDDDCQAMVKQWDEDHSRK